LATKLCGPFFLSLVTKAGVGYSQTLDSEVALLDALAVELACTLATDV
jgi:hypothetical protein